MSFEQNQGQTFGDNNVYPSAPAPAPVSTQETLVATFTSRAQTVLILGILSIFLGIITGIPAWVMGHSVMKDARAEGVPESVVSNANIGRIIGMVITILSAVMVVLWIVIAIMALSATVSTGPATWPSPVA